MIYWAALSLFTIVNGLALRALHPTSCLHIAMCLRVLRDALVSQVNIDL